MAINANKDGMITFKQRFIAFVISLKTLSPSAIIRIHSQTVKPAARYPVSSLIIFFILEIPPLTYFKYMCLNSLI